MFKRWWLDNKKFIGKVCLIYALTFFLIVRCSLHPTKAAVETPEEEAWSTCAAYADNAVNIFGDLSMDYRANALLIMAFPDNKEKTKFTAFVDYKGGKNYFNAEVPIQYQCKLKLNKKGKFEVTDFIQTKG